MNETPGITDQNPRQKALTIATYLRRNHLTGIENDEHYHDLQNNFIGIALHDQNHPSLPLISVAIFCSVAKRLGLNASPCGFPFHVLAIIKPSGNIDLDGREIQDTSNSEPMYMDPYRSEYETPVSDLRHQLSSMGVASSDYPTLLDTSSTADIIRRAVRNIIASVRIRSHNHVARVPPDSNFPLMDSAFYGALWALLILPDANPATASVQRASYLPYLMELLEKKFFLDVKLIEEYILPLFADRESYAQLQNAIRLIRAGDVKPKTVKRRSQQEASKVKYHVGQVFRHKRYRYQAVITGWDVECAATEEWMSHMGIDDLSGGRRQSFYQVLYALSPSD